jgi:hypothetical protein
MARPPGVSKAEWRADVQRREAVTADRRNRLIAKRARDTAAAAAAEASRAGMMNLPPDHCPQAAWGSQASVASPVNLSPPPPQWGYTPSPGYSDGDAHGGFNPNITFPHGAPPRASPSTPTSALPPPHSPPASTPSTATRRRRTQPRLRRGALPFAHDSEPQFSNTDATDADMDEIITSGSVAAVSCPGFHAQDDTMDADMDDELDDAEEEGKEDEQAEEEAEPAPTTKGRKRKRAANARPGEPRVKRTSKEDECLAEAWKTVSIDLITGTNQNTDMY